MIGGIPEVAAEAKLITVPEVEPVSLHTSSDVHAMVNEVLGGTRASITVEVRTEKASVFALRRMGLILTPLNARKCLYGRSLITPLHRD